MDIKIGDTVLHKASGLHGKVLRRGYQGYTVQGVDFMGTMTWGEADIVTDAHTDQLRSLEDELEVTKKALEISNIERDETKEWAARRGEEVSAAQRKVDELLKDNRDLRGQIGELQSLLTKPKLEEAIIGEMDMAFGRPAVLRIAVSVA